MLLKFNANVQIIHRPDRLKQHSDLGQSNSSPIMCILPLQRSRFICFGLVGPTINCVPSTLWYIYWWPIYFTFTPDIEWSKRLGEIKMACCKVCHGHFDTRLVTWHQHRVEVQTSNQTQQEASKCVPEHSFAGQKLRCFSVGELCLA